MDHKRHQSFNLVRLGSDINLYFGSTNNSITNLCTNTLGIEPIQIFKPIKGLKFRTAKKKYNYIKNTPPFQVTLIKTPNIHKLAKPNQKLSYCRHIVRVQGLSTINKIL